MATADLPEGPPAPDHIRLHHGSDVVSANNILNNGLSLALALQAGGTGEFWATIHAADADTFAQVNPAGGVPARYSFDLPRRVLAALLASVPPRAYQHGADWYEFLPGSYALLNQHMTARQVISPVP
jgi:hypothetical protein